MKGENLSLLEKQQLVESYQSEIKKFQFQTSLLKETVKQLKESIKADKKRSIAESAAAIVSAVESTKTVKRRPGRPKKSASSGTASTATKKKRGRPSKKATEPKSEKSGTGKKRGRPKKAKSASVKAATTTKKRGPGRPKKAASSSTAPSNAKPKKRGRKPNQKVGGYRLSEWDSLIVNGIKDAGKALVKNELLELAEKKNKSDKMNMDMQAINVKISQSLHKLANRRDDLVKVPFPGRGFAYALGEWKNSKGDVPKKYHRK